MGAPPWMTKVSTSYLPCIDNVVFYIYTFCDLLSDIYGKISFTEIFGCFYFDHCAELSFVRWFSFLEQYQSLNKYVIIIIMPLRSFLDY